MNKFGFTPLSKRAEENIPQQEEILTNDINKETQQIDQPKKFNFSSVKMGEKQQEQQKETRFQSGVRNLSGNIARGLEAVLGSAGEFQGLAEYVTKPLADYLLPIEESKKDMVKTTLPTSTELRKKTKEYTGEYLEPKGKIESSLQEASSLAGSLLGPMKFRRALAIAAGAQGAKEGLGLLGATPNQKEAGKFGTMFALSMVNPNGIKKYWRDLYDKRDALTPTGTWVDGKLLEKEAKNVINEIKKGTVAPSEAKVLDQAEKVLEKVHFGKVDLNEMVAVKRSLNEVAGDPELWKRGQHLFPNLQKAVSETLSLHPNKEASKLGKMADEAFGGFMQSQKATRFINKAIGEKPFKSLLLSLGVEALSGNAGAILPTIGGAGAAALSVKGYELLSRINANPTLRKYYLDVIKNAAKEDLVATQKSLRKLDEEMYRQEKSKARKD